MKSVTGVFQGLGGSDVDVMHRGAREAEQPRERSRDALLGGADDDERGGEEVVEARAFAEELRAHRCSHGPSVREQLGFEDRGNNTVDGSWRNRAAHDDRVEAARGWLRRGHRTADVLDRPRKVGEISVPECRRRGADAEQRDVCTIDRLDRTTSDTERAGLHTGCDQRLEVRLDDRASALPDSCDLRSLYVDTDDVVPSRCEAC